MEFYEKHYLRMRLLTPFSRKFKATLNSKPQTPMSFNPNDLEALTPDHFLIDTVFTSLPFLELSSKKIISLSSRQHVQRYEEYLSELNLTSKWYQGISK